MLAVFGFIKKMKLRCALCLWLLKTIFAQSSNCDFYQYVNTTTRIESPRFPRSYTGGLKCRWIADCPPGYNCRLNCDIMLPKSKNCQLDQLLVSKSGDPQLNEADTYCGRGTFTITSTGQRISVGLMTSNRTPGGRFYCQVTPQRATPSPQCKCGEKRQNRIVGGQETGVNEYKMMAGLVDPQGIRCGAVLISDMYVLTAAHCLVNQNVSDIGVVVGEHDVTTGEETSAAQVYRVAKYTIHPSYNDATYDYDIAIVKVTRPIQFNDRVGPVCLPFKFVSRNFTSSKVTVLGWGTLFPGGPKSKVLLEAELDVISQNDCAATEPRLTPRQMCTLTPGKDACQYDSGGPLLYTDPATGLLFNVGIVSSGRFCASRSPGINTRVTALLDWIVSTTRVDYCVK